MYVPEEIELPEEYANFVLFFYALIAQYVFTYATWTSPEDECVRNPAEKDCLRIW